MKEQEKEIIEQILWCYTQIKNPTFFDVIPKSKNHQHPLQNDRDNWPEVDWQKRSGFEAIGGLGRLVGWWRQASVAVTLTMSRASGGKQSELERPELREWAWERWALEMKWEWAWERWASEMSWEWIREREARLRDQS